MREEPGEERGETQAGKKARSNLAQRQSSPNGCVKIIKFWMNVWHNKSTEEMASLWNLERVTSSVRRGGEEWFGHRHAWPPPPLLLEVGHGCLLMMWPSRWTALYIFSSQSVIDGAPGSDWLPKRLLFTLLTRPSGSAKTKEGCVIKRMTVH